MKLTIVGLEGFPIWGNGQKHDLNREIITCLAQAGVSIDDGDILVVTHKVVSKGEGSVIDLRSVTPGVRAFELAQRTGKDPRLVEVILQESKEVLRISNGLIITEHRLGFICANAGVDRSNSGDLSGEKVVLLPRDPDRSAREIREALRQAFHKNVGIIISDTHGRAFRDGIIGICIGIAGAPVMWDLRGRKDLFGYTMTSSIECVADELASAAALVMGQCDEGIPLALIKGFPWSSTPGLQAHSEESSCREIIRDKEKDLFR